MVKFRTIISFARYFTDSRLTLIFNSLCSMEFLTFTVAAQLPGWDMEELQYFAEWDGMAYVWEGKGAPKEFIGDWQYLERTDA